jgi:hypothetical protein
MTVTNRTSGHPLSLRAPTYNFAAWVLDVALGLPYLKQVCGRGGGSRYSQPRQGGASLRTSAAPVTGAVLVAQLRRALHKRAERAEDAALCVCAGLGRVNAARVKVQAMPHLLELLRDVGMGVLARPMQVEDRLEHALQQFLGRPDNRGGVVGPRASDTNNVDGKIVDAQVTTGLFDCVEGAGVGNVQLRVQPRIMVAQPSLQPDKFLHQG